KRARAREPRHEGQVSACPGVPGDRHRDQAKDWPQPLSTEIRTSPFQRSATHRVCGEGVSCSNRRLSMSKVQPKLVVPMNHGSVAGMEKFFTAKEKSAKPGMFGRLFPELRALAANRQDLVALGTAMIETAPQSKNKALDTTIPAGFTFLGQLADHDI